MAVEGLRLAERVGRLVVASAAAAVLVLVLLEWFLAGGVVKGLVALVGLMVLAAGWGVVQLGAGLMRRLLASVKKKTWAVEALDVTASCLVWLVWLVVGWGLVLLGRWLLLGRWE